jgi:hypothetical protein
MCIINFYGMSYVLQFCFFAGKLIYVQTLEEYSFSL